VLVRISHVEVFKAWDSDYQPFYCPPLPSSWFPMLRRFDREVLFNLYQKDPFVFSFPPPSRRLFQPAAFRRSNLLSPPCRPPLLTINKVDQPYPFPLPSSSTVSTPSFDLFSQGESPPQNRKLFVFFHYPPHPPQSTRPLCWIVLASTSFPIQYVPCRISSTPCIVSYCRPRAASQLLLIPS